MKQLAFMIAFTALGTAGVVFNPFYGVFVYYLFAVLRPQFIWKWSLPEGVAWSFYVATATIGATVLALFGVLPPDKRRPAEGDPGHRMTFGHLCFALFAVWVCVTYVTARNHNAAYPWFLEYLKIFVLYFVAAYLTRSLGQVWALFLMIGFTLGYISYEVNFLYFVNGYLGIHRNGYGGLDNNGAGLMLAMGVPICWFAFEGGRGWWRWLFLLLIPVIVHAVLMTYSRGAMLSILISLPVIIIRSQMKLRLLGGLALFVVLLLPTLAGKEIRERFFTIQSHEVDESANSRRQSWLAAYRMAQDNPIFGVGVRNSNLFSYQYGADRVGRTIHSQYLQILADNGFVGLGLYIMVICSSVFGLWRARALVEWRDDVEAMRIRAMCGGVEATLVLFCFGGAFLSLEVFELPFLVLFLGTQLGLVSERGEVPSVAEVATEGEDALTDDREGRHAGAAWG